jgi:hypothetical protein
LALRTAPRHPALAWRAVYWYVRGKRLRARNLLAQQGALDRADARRADRFLAASPLSGIPAVHDVVDLSRPVAVYVWSGGNFFFADIAAYVVTLLRRLGAQANLSEENAPPPPGSELVIVAPHEFCVYGPGRHWPAESLDRAIPFNTEQWHTPWFALARPFLTRARRGLDLNPASAAGLIRDGVACGFLPLLPLAGTPFLHGDTPLSPQVTAARHFPRLTWPAAHADRPIDIAFVAVGNPRRGAALAALAPVLARHRCLIHVPSFDAPVRPGDPDMIGAADMAQIARNTKILLNIHQGGSHYFEWHRIVITGVMEGCVVVSEPNLATGILRPGEHLIEAPLERLGAELVELLETEPGLARLETIHTAAMALRTRVLAQAESAEGLAALCRPLGWGTG